MNKTRVCFPRRAWLAGITGAAFSLSLAISSCGAGVTTHHAGAHIWFKAIPSSVEGPSWVEDPGITAPPISEAQAIATARQHDAGTMPSSGPREALLGILMPKNRLEWFFDLGPGPFNVAMPPREDGPRCDDGSPPPRAMPGTTPSPTPSLPRCPSPTPQASPGPMYGIATVDATTGEFITAEWGPLPSA